MPGPTVKGRVPADHFPTNRAELTIAGLGPVIDLLKLGELPDTTKSAEAPDGTVVTSGEKEAGTVDFEIPMSNLPHVLLLDAWAAEAVGFVSPTYKRLVTVAYPSVSGTQRVVRNLTGAWLMAGVDGESDLGGTGVRVRKYTLSYDEVAHV